MMDLISSFMNKNLEDFMKSYASTILPTQQATQDESENEKKSDTTPQKQNPQLIEHKEYSQTESPQLLSPDSFLNKSVAESIASDIAHTTADDTIHITGPDHSNPHDRNNKMYGEYGKGSFDLSMDILPTITMEHEHTSHNDYSMLLSEPPDEQWTELPHVVYNSIHLETSKATKNTTTCATANDSFLQNIAKEIELLDEELSSMGVLNTPKLVVKPNTDDKAKNQEENEAQTVYSSDMEHDEEEKMDRLHHKETAANPCNNQAHNVDNQEENEDDIVIIKDKLSLLRKSMVFKKKKETKLCKENTDPNSVSKPKKDGSENQMYFDEFGVFESQILKDAYFDPLVSPIKVYNKATHHEAASKIQKQWKRFQFKTLLVQTFNRHLKQSQAQSKELPITIADVIAETTHEIVDHAEKLFALVHQNNSNNTTLIIESKPSVGNLTYNQLHFYGSPALDWSAVYSMIESIALRNLLYYKNSHMVKRILDTQRIMDDIVSSSTLNTQADQVLIEQLTTQLIQLKTTLYEDCWGSNMLCDIHPLKLFPKDVNIFRSDATLIFKSTRDTSLIKHETCTKSPSTKPELKAIRSQLTLLRKSFSKRRTSSRMHRISDSLPTSSKVFTFENDAMQRPQTAPIAINNDSLRQYPSPPPSASNSRYERPVTKPYLKRKPKIKPMPKKIDWSHVKPKTVSRLSNTVRVSRTANQNRGQCRASAINWKERVSSRVDCNWSSKRSKQKRRKPTQKRERANAFEDSYKHCMNKRKEDDKYLYYLTKENKIGKISRDSAAAQLQDGSGPMILKTNQTYNDEEEEVEQDRVQIISASTNIDTDYDEEYVSYDESHDGENQLQELQKTFAAIEQAMKQRREQQYS